MTLTEDRTRSTTGHGVRRTDPVLGWAGTGTAVVAFAVLLVPHASLDKTSPSADEVTTFFTDHYVMQQAQPLLHSLSGVLLLLFTVRLAGLLGELGGSRPADLVRAAGTALAAVVIVTMAWVAAVVTLTGDIEGTTQWSLYTIGWDFHFRLLYLLPLILLPTGWLLRRTGAPVVGWSAVVLGALTAVAPLGYLGQDTWFVQYPAYMLFLLWTLGAGIALGFRGVRRAD